MLFRSPYFIYLCAPDGLLPAEQSSANIMARGTIVVSDEVPGANNENIAALTLAHQPFVGKSIAIGDAVCVGAAWYDNANGGWYCQWCSAGGIHRLESSVRPTLATLSAGTPTATYSMETGVSGAPASPCYSAVPVFEFVPVQDAANSASLSCSVAAVGTTDLYAANFTHGQSAAGAATALEFQGTPWEVDYDFKASTIGGSGGVFVRAAGWNW